MIIRIIGLIIILMLLYRMYMTVEKHLLRKQIEKKKKDGQSKMIRCQQCGLYVPMNEALEHKGVIFCSSSCQDEHKNNKS